MMEKQLQVLDHGYVRFVEHWGGGEAGVDEAGIIEAARMSTQGSFRGWDQDQKLLAYLYNNKHLSPFEFCGMTLEIQAPIFVFREAMRHRTFSFNEMSARYGVVPDLNYIPHLGNLLERANAVTKNKQAQGSGQTLTREEALNWLGLLDELYTHAESVYQTGIKVGVPRELARIPMPVGRYSRMRMTGNLRNWLQFLTLRLDPAAQHEIRVVAEAVGYFIEHRFPKTWNLFKGNEVPSHKTHDSTPTEQAASTEAGEE